MFIVSSISIFSLLSQSTKKVTPFLSVWIFKLQIFRAVNSSVVLEGIKTFFYNRV